MLQTLYAIGKDLSQGRDPWTDFLEPPKTDAKDNDRRLLVLNVLLDIDNATISVSNDRLEVFENSIEKLKKWRTIKVAGGNSKAAYIAVDASKLNLLAKTLFGKPDTQGLYPEEGEFLEAIRKEAPEVENTLFGQALKNLVKLRHPFFQLFIEGDYDPNSEKQKWSIKKVNEQLELAKNERIVLVYVSILDSSLDIDDTPIGHLEGYETFIERKFLRQNIEEPEEAKNAIKKLCYATGQFQEDVEEASFSGRYNINKYFQNTTLNFASNFDKDNLSQNYQLSREMILSLDRGADYLLKNMVCEIADVRHVIIPHFFNQDEFRIKRLQPISKEVDLLFRLNQLNAVETFLDNYAETQELYWITFLGIDSDGNYFKANNLIKDVPNFHFRNILKAFEETGALLKPWLGEKYMLNFGSLYNMIPVRKDKEKVNKALLLFSSILEQKKIDASILFKHFQEIILCHWFARYKGYANQKRYERHKAGEMFDFKAKDAVFSYLALFLSLQKLQLLQNKLFDMEMEKMETKPRLSEGVEAFLDGMTFNQQQRALFYLGRVLNRVVYEQSGVKKHKKNALDKLNYNGMDKQSIFRFANELFESARHHDISDFVKKDWGKFAENFDLNSWKMDGQEALFFILTGYTYGIKTTEKTES